MDIEIPGYKLLRTLGKGGMATVFLAKQAVLERQVALKVMSKSLAEDPAFGQRFMREAKIVSQLVHPNIVTVHEVGQHNGHYYLSMEYIDGHDLRTVRKKLDILEKIRVVEDIARALHYAGEKGYVHRDIKPENIMFRSTDGSAVLTDFGIAKAVENDLTMTQTGTAIGTPHYMSPEQAKGKKVDHRSDLYSLGVVFFLLLTGRVPYDADTAVAIGVKHITEPVPVLPPSLALLQPVVDGLLSKDVQNRYQSGLALLNDLRSLDFRELERAVERVESQQTHSHSASSSAAKGEPDDEDGSSRFTIEYSINETIERPPTTFWPTFFASTFIVLAVLTIVYISRPKSLEPVIVEVESAGRFVATYFDGFTGSAIDKVNNWFPEKSEDRTNHAESVPRVTPEVNVSQSLLAEQTGSTIDERISVERIEQENNQNPLVEGAITRDENDSAELAVIDVPSIEVLEDRIALLATSAKNDRAMIGEYVKALNELLHYYPDHQSTLASLTQLKVEHQELIFEFAEKGDRARVDQQLATYKARYPESVAEEALQVERNAEKKLKVSELLQRATSHRKNGAIYEPAEENALAAYQAALLLDANNTEASASLLDISVELLTRAEKSIALSELERANTELEFALEANPKNEKAMMLRSDVVGQIKQRDSIEQAMVNAEKYKGMGHLFTPAEANAYDQYDKVLALESRNVAAQQGIDELVDALSVKVWALVGQEKFDEARTVLERPTALMPDNERIKSMRVAVDEVAQR